MQAIAKNRIKNILKIGIILLIGYLFISIIQTYQIKKERNSKAEMPDFEFVRLDSKRYIKADLPTDKSFFVIIRLSSECGSCQEVLKEIAKSKISSSNTHLIFVVDNFEYELIPNIPQNIESYTLCSCESNSFFHQFGQIATPSTFIYGTQKQLLVKYTDVKDPLLWLQVNNYLNKE